MLNSAVGLESRFYLQNNLLHVARGGQGGAYNATKYKKHSIQCPEHRWYSIILGPIIYKTIHLKLIKSLHPFIILSSKIILDYDFLKGVLGVPGWLSRSSMKPDLWVMGSSPTGGREFT